MNASTKPTLSVAAIRIMIHLSSFFWINECSGQYDLTCYGLLQVADYHSSSNDAGKTGWFHESYGLTVPNAQDQKYLNPQH